MKVKDLSPTIIEALKIKRYDRIVEKHEGPETWDWQLPPDQERVDSMKALYRNLDEDYSADNHAEFIQIADVDVLLPISLDILMKSGLLLIKNTILLLF